MFKRNRDIVLTFALLAVVLVLSVFKAHGQSSTSLQRTCPGASPSPATTTVAITKAGDINLVPCATKKVYISGSALDAITLSGSSRTNYFPFFSTATNLAKSPFSWDLTSYGWNNTTLDATFTMGFTPSKAGVGTFTLGDTDPAGTRYLMRETDNYQLIQAPGGSINLISSGGLVQIGQVAGLGAAANTNINCPNGACTIGDASSAGNAIKFTVDDANSLITLQGPTHFQNLTVKTALILDAFGNVSGTTLTNGQLLIGSTGITPQAGTITAGTGISVTNGAGSITIADTNPTVLKSVLASDFTNATTTLNNTALSVTTIGKSYAFDAELYVSDSVAADGVKLDFGGGACTFTNFVAGGNSVLVTAVTTSSTGTFSNATVTGSNLISIHGSIEVNSGGTFIIRAAQVAHTAGTLTVMRGSSLILTQLN